MKKLLFALLSMFPLVTFADMAVGPYDDPWNRNSDPYADSYVSLVLDRPIILFFVTITIVIVVLLVVNYFKNRR